MRTDFFSSTPLKTPWIVSSDQARAIRLAALARQALIAEAELTPKPGLVDRRGTGAHSDLSLAIMTQSARAIEPYLCEMALISGRNYPSQPLRERLAAIGREAEHAMLKATSGSNAHKGAIWILGLLTSGAAMQDEDQPPASTISGTAKRISAFEDRATPRLLSHGDLVARRYGVTGARGEATGGFPHVVEIGLPILHSRRTSGATETVARLDTLLGIMSCLDDTCLLYRGGEEALVTAKAGAAAIKSAGGSGTTLGKQRLQHLDHRLLELGVSPGGSGDLLAATLFLDAVERGENEVQADRSGSEEIYGAD
jgi:triphosphoribosyl-dephospho-CoA synthase